MSTPSPSASETRTRRDSTKRIRILVKRLMNLLVFSRPDLTINTPHIPHTQKCFISGFPASLACSLILTLLLGGLQVRPPSSVPALSPVKIDSSFYCLSIFAGSRLASHHYSAPLISDGLYLDCRHSHVTPCCPTEVIFYENIFLSVQ